MFTRADDCSLGVLHSRVHEVWALAQGTQLREKASGFRYTPTSCFETFPFPLPTSAQEAAIAAAAKELNGLRERWLNPPEWTVGHTSSNSPARQPARGHATWSTRTRTVSAPCAIRVKKRTLTNLYNERPAWLDLAHKKIDAAVAAAYGGPPDLTEDQILEKLLPLNLERAAEEAKAAKTQAPKAQRAKREDELV